MTAPRLPWQRTGDNKFEAVRHGGIHAGRASVYRAYGTPDGGTPWRWHVEYADKVESGYAHTKQDAADRATEMLPMLMERIDKEAADTAALLARLDALEAGTLSVADFRLGEQTLVELQTIMKHVTRRFHAHGNASPFPGRALMDELSREFGRRRGVSG